MESPVVSPNCLDFFRARLPELLARDERFAREFERQQADLSALALRCGEAARLLKLGAWLREAMAAAEQSLEQSKAAGFLQSLSFLTADLKYQRLERIRALGRELQKDMAPFCARLTALGLTVSIDVSAEIEGLDDDAGRMMACLGISNGHMSPEDEVNKIRVKWRGSSQRLEGVLEELRALHADRLQLLERKQQAFIRLLENAGGEPS